MKFTIVGSIFDSSGYSIHTRELFKALSNIADVRLEIPLIPNWNRLITDKELEAIKKPDDKDRIRIIITSPLYWKLNTTTGRNWAYMIWEGNKVPKCFIEECLNPDIEYILCPSNHTKQAILNTSSEKDTEIELLNKKIRIIHHGVDLNLFYPKEKPNKCIFIANKGLRGPEDRGGLQYLIKAFIEEFTEEDVELIIKINPAYGIIDINNLMMQMQIPAKKYPKITINNQLMNYEELVKFYNQGTVFVSPTRAESFNIPCLEAMACGLPVLTTNFGGQTDFVNEENGWLIGGEMTEVKWDLMYEGISWLIPYYQDLRKMLRWIFEHTEGVNKKSQKALETAKQFTWENSAKKLIDLI